MLVRELRIFWTSNFLISVVSIKLRQYAQSLCERCEVRFFGRSCKNFAGILSYVKKFLCDMMENMQADFVQSRHPGFVRYWLMRDLFS